MNGTFDVSKEESGASSTHNAYTMGELVKGNFEVREEEATTMDNNGLPSSHTFEGTRITEMKEGMLMVGKNTMEVLENNISNDQQVVAPHQGRFWTVEEHK